jgi:hypothetical protein
MTTRTEYLETLGLAYLRSPIGSNAEVLLRYAVDSELYTGGAARLLSALEADGPVEACADEDPSPYDPPEDA